MVVSLTPSIPLIITPLSPSYLKRGGGGWKGALIRGREGRLGFEQGGDDGF